MKAYRKSHASSSIDNVVENRSYQYHLKYDIGYMTPEEARERLHSNFNKTFPILDAPKDFPKPGDRIPLVGGLFPVIMEGEREGNANGYRSWGYDFRSDRGHFDGEGSTVKLRVVQAPNGRSQLNVDAEVRTLPSHREMYTAVALHQVWSSFAENLTS